MNAKEGLDKAWINGLEFLQKNQLPHGEFMSFEIKEEVQKDFEITEKGKYASSTYITSYILYSLSFIEHPAAKNMIEKGLAFISEQLEEPGIWRFYTKERNLKIMGGQLATYTATGLTPDLDDTAVCSYALKSCGINFDQSKGVFTGNKNSNGTYYTWLLDFPKSKYYTESTQYYEIFKNDICIGVNANILLYLGENEETYGLCEYINTQIMQENNGCSENIYFHGMLTVYYLISRAYYRSAPSLSDAMKKITQAISAMQKEDGSFGNVIFTAFAVCTLINFDIWDERIERGLNHILSRQNENGSWDKYVFFYGYKSSFCSQELTTAICMEAVYRVCDRMIQKSKERQQFQGVLSWRD